MKRIPILLVVFTLTGLTARADWSRFRGPNGTGISDAKTVPVEWTDADYNWKVPLPGVGHASPIVVGDRIYVTCSEEDTAERRIVCLNTGDGKTRWERSYKSSPFRKHRDNNYASSTPAADSSGVVFTWFSPKQVLLLALDHDGNKVWRRDLGPYKATNGGATSPIIVDDLVIFMNSQMDPEVMKKFLPKGTPITEPGKSSCVAFDRATGQPRWKLDRKTHIAGYATPCVRELDGGGRELVFTDSAHGMMGVDLRTGTVNWETDRILKTRTVVSPVLAGDLVLGSHGPSINGEQLFAVRPHKESGKATVEYELKKSVPLVPTPIYKDGLVFLWADNGIVSCIKAPTGEEVWRERVGGSFYASPVWVDGRLYGVDRDGTVVVLAASATYKLLSRVSLDEPNNATPAVSDGVMYFRTKTQLISLGGKSPKKN